VLVWLSVWSKVQIVCLWSSWCHCHPITPSSLASFKSRLVLPFWYRLTQVVLEQRLLNRCSSSSSRSRKWFPCFWTPIDALTSCSVLKWVTFCLCCLQPGRSSRTVNKGQLLFCYKIRRHCSDRRTATWTGRSKISHPRFGILTTPVLHWQ